MPGGSGRATELKIHIGESSKMNMTIFVNQGAKFASGQNLSVRLWGGKLWANYFLSMITI